jgi:hypothetical protein
LLPAGNFLISAKQILAVPAVTPQGSYTFCYLRLGTTVVDTTVATFDFALTPGGTYIGSQMQQYAVLQSPTSVVVSCYNNTAGSGAQAQNYNLYAIKAP